MNKQRGTDLSLTMTYLPKTVVKIMHVVHSNTLVDCFSVTQGKWFNLLNMSMSKGITSILNSEIVDVINKYSCV